MAMSREEERDSGSTFAASFASELPPESTSRHLSAEARVQPGARITPAKHRFAQAGPATQETVGTETLVRPLSIDSTSELCETLPEDHSSHLSLVDHSHQSVLPLSYAVSTTLRRVQSWLINRVCWAISGTGKTLGNISLQMGTRSNLDVIRRSTAVRLGWKPSENQKIQKLNLSDNEEIDALGDFTCRLVCTLSRFEILVHFFVVADSHMTNMEGLLGNETLEIWEKTCKSHAPSFHFSMPAS